MMQQDQIHYLSGPPDRMRPLRTHSHRPEPSLTVYLKLLLERKWTVIVLFLFGILFAVVVNFVSTPFYASQAVLEIAKDDTNPIEKASENLVPVLYDKDYFDTQLGILKSRSLAAELIDALHLQNSPEFRETTSVVSSIVAWVYRFIPTNSSEAPYMEGIHREELIDKVIERLAVNRIKKSNLVSVSLSAKDRMNSQTMLERYIQLYLNRNLSKRRQASTEASLWLGREIEQSEAKLIQSIHDLVNFKSQHDLVSMDNADNHFMAIFNKSAESLLRSTEHRIQVESLKQGTDQDGMLLPTEARSAELWSLSEKLVSLENQADQMREIYNRDYPKLVLLDQQTSAIKKRIAELRNLLRDESIEAAVKQEAAQKQAFDAAKRDAMNTNDLGIQYAILKKDQETNEEIHRILLTKRKELDLSTRVIGNNVHLVDTPTIPINPIKPEKLLNIAAGGFIGLFVGITGALVINSLDKKIRSSNDLEVTLGIPFLGSIPYTGRRFIAHQRQNQFAENGLMATRLNRSRFAESIRSINTTLRLSMQDSDYRTLLVAAAGPSEGKTFFSVALGCELASSGKKVLILEADLRRPRLRELFRESGENNGLSDALDQEKSFHLTVCKTQIRGLHFIPAGKCPENPPALLGSRRMSALLAKLKDKYDFILVDSPPILGLSDSAILSSQVDAVICVIEHARFPSPVLKRAIKTISLAGRPILGAVINKSDESTMPYKSRYSRHYLDH
jgi:capsular exopolysaccharide synthesis family protein